MKGISQVIVVGLRYANESLMLGFAPKSPDMKRYIVIVVEV